MSEFPRQSKVDEIYARLRQATDERVRQAGGELASRQVKGSLYAVADYLEDMEYKFEQLERRLDDFIREQKP